MKDPRTTATINRSWSTNSHRRNKEQMTYLRARIYRLLEARHPMTIRQLFYQMVGAGLISKTEAAYRGITVRLCGQMREDGELPWEWIADHSRWMRKPQSYSSVEEVLRRTATTYRRDLWLDQDAYCELWCEKETLAGVLYEITREYDVPLMIVKGFPSKDFVHGAAMTIQDIGKRAFVYYVGDHDPSGLAIWNDVQAKLSRYAPESDITFLRIAVTEWQIDHYNLPTRPTKIAKNPHAKNWHKNTQSVEVDALPVNALQDIARAAIEQHIDQHQLQITKQAEESERAQLRAWAIPVGRKRKPNHDGD